MSSVQDWIQIRRLHRAEGCRSGRSFGCWDIEEYGQGGVASDGPLKCERVQRGSIVNEMEPPIRELLKAYPQMPATVIAERIGWPTPNSGIDLSTLGATLDVRVNGGIHIRLREALGPIRGLPSIPSPKPIADLWSVLGR